MPRVLRNLKISEVSSVDKGAGEGVRVVLLKRDGQAAHPAIALAAQLLELNPDFSATRAIAHAAALIRSTKVTKTAPGMRVVKLDDGSEFQIPDQGWEDALKAAGIEEKAATPVDKVVDVIAIAKALADGSIRQTTLTAADFHAATRREAAKRFPSLSPQQAVAKFVAEDDTGRVLFAAEKAAPSYDVTQVTNVPQQGTAAYRELMRLAQEMASGDPDRSFYDCMLAVMATPRGRELYEEARQQSLRASLSVIQGSATIGPWQDVEDLPLPAAPDGLTDRRYRYPTGNASVPGRGQGYERFKQAVADIRKAAPTLTASEAQTKARRDHPELWRAAKAEGVTPLA